VVWSSFATPTAGGYTGLISGDFRNPIGNRQAWTGTSPGFVTTIVRLPPAANGQNIQLRWRLGTDYGQEAAGWSIDSVQFYTYQCGPGAVSPPGPLFKVAPSNGAVSVSISPSLSWVPAVGGTRYEYCVDRVVNNSTCETGWVNVGAATSVVLTSLEPGKPYQWQVRAVNAGGSTQADVGVFWPMITMAPPNPLADVIVDFGSGVGLWAYFDAGGAAFLSRIHPLSPTLTARANLNGNAIADLVVNFPGFGVWAFVDNTGWQIIHPWEANSIQAGDVDGGGRDDLVIDFQGGAGIWILYDNGNWGRLHTLGATAIAIGNLDGTAGGRADIVIGLAGFGTYVFLNNSTWVFLSGSAARNLQFGDLDGNGLGDLVAHFPGFGQYILYNGSEWLSLHPLEASGFMTGNFDNDAANLSDVIVALPGNAGTWAFVNGNTWLKIHALPATIMTTGDVDGDGSDDIILGFAGRGLWRLRNLTTWLPLHGLTPESVVTGRFSPN